MSGAGDHTRPGPASDSERGDAGAERLAEGFAQHVERWARRLQAEGSTGEQGDTPPRAATRPPAETDFALLRHAAYHTSLATSNGHVCLMLPELVGGGGAGPGQGSPDELRASLLASMVVGTPAAPGACPLILDEDGRLYLHRYFDYEVRLARRIVQATRTPPRPVTPAARELLNSLFPAASDREIDWQKIAAALALRNTFTLVSGGPGTGKTTTVVNLLACLLTQEPNGRVALAAPTGKAAARMTEAIRQRAGHLPEALRERLPGESFTVHRLLGVHPGRAEFTYHAGNPLPYDTLIVDEASMLDLALATRLLEAVPAGARVILLGDKDQLAAVEAGAVFAELSAGAALSDACRRDIEDICGYPAVQVVAPAAAGAGPLRDAAVWLTKNYRFSADSAIGQLAQHVNEGKAQEAMTLLRAGRDARASGGAEPAAAVEAAATKPKGGRKRQEDTASFSLFPELDPSSAAPAPPASGHDGSIRWLGPDRGDDALEAILAGYAGYFETVRRDPADVQAVLRAFNAFRVLCAVREGAGGSNWVNEQVTRRAPRLLAPVAAEGTQEPRALWYAGRPVMVLRNDYVLKLFNGDIGIALPAGGALAAFFPDADEGVRTVPIARMPPHETAFATTVHKAQGSEFDAVLLSLPRQAGRVAVRELLYTGVTRARTAATIAAASEVIARTIDAKLERHSGLLARVQAASELAGDR